MTIERKDKLINKAKVTKSLLKDPTQSQRQVAKDTWLSLGNVNDKVNELEQSWTESNIMDKILQNDDKIMDLANEITLQKIIDEAPKNDDWSVNVSALSLQDIKTIWDLANNSTKRKALFWKKDNWEDNKIQFIIG